MALTFRGPLDVALAADVSRYVVEVNGEVVAVLKASYDTASYRVTLSLPQGSLEIDDRVTVFWNDLRDAEGRTLTGQTGPLNAR